MRAPAWHWFVRLARRGKDAARFPATLAACAALARAPRPLPRWGGAGSAMCRHGGPGGVATASPVGPLLDGLGKAWNSSTRLARCQHPDTGVLTRSSSATTFPPGWGRGANATAAFVSEMMASERTKDVAARHGLRAAPARVSRQLPPRLTR